MAGKTMFDKIWDSHIVDDPAGEPTLLYVDLHLIHEVTSPQAFEGLRLANRKVRRPDLTIATVDHNIPTTDRTLPIEDPISEQQINTLSDNVKEFGIKYYGVHSPEQGIVHVIGPQEGYTQPGKIIVCGDSHTATHGAFGALAIPLGTSQVEHVLATQCLLQEKPKTMEIKINGELPKGVSAKDVILGIIGKIGVDGGSGYAIEYTGEVIRSLPMEGRMTICNMSIEAGARVGMIAPDATTFNWLRGKNQVPQGDDFDLAIKEWEQLSSDSDAIYDTTIEINASELEPYVTWGTNPGQVLSIQDSIPDPAKMESAEEIDSAIRALEYMDLKPNTPITEISVDRVFIGSCTNSRITDLRAAAEIINGYKVNPNVNAIVVPGSTLIKWQAEKEGLDLVFKEAGFEWREAGCSMCLGMNPDTLDPHERCASTSNRNFEGRQGKDGRTHLVSPQMAAAAAIEGHFIDVREWEFKK
jgi:3-isopropylmalate/(R)-2-methylmalate dehydratase large subunit